MVFFDYFICGEFITNFFKGLNYGIDFKGGTLIEVQINNNITISNLRSALNELNLGDVNVKNFGKEGNYLIKIEEKIENKENFIKKLKLL